MLINSINTTEKTASGRLPIVVRRWRAEMPYMLAVFIAALLLYAYTAPHTVALEDDGLFIGNLHFFGVAHPPGYPLHTLLGGIFYHLLPFGSPAYKAHLFSGVAAAAACSAVYAVTALIAPGRLLPLLAAVIFAVSKLLWSQAIIAEVYTLNAFLFFLLLALAVSYVANNNNKTLFFMALVCGLGLANHHPLFILAGSGIAVYVLVQIPRKIRTLLIGMAVALITAGIFYAWMVWRSYSNVPAHFLGLPLDSTQAFFDYLARNHYQARDYQTNATWDDKFRMGKFFLQETLTQYTPAGVVLALTGIVATLRRKAQRLLSLSLLISAFSVSILLIIIRDAQATYTGLAVYRAYHITTYGILAIFLALGSAVIAQQLARWSNTLPRFFMIMTALLIPFTAALHWSDNNRRDYHWAETLAWEKLNQLEDNAILFTSGDFDLPIGYLHYVKGARPDVTVLNVHGLIYGNPFYVPHLDKEKKREILSKMINSSYRPIYFSAHLTDFFPSYHSDMLGFNRQINRHSGNRIILSPAMLAWLQKNINSPLSAYDRWARHQYNRTINNLISAALALQWSGGELPPQWQEIIEQAKNKSLPLQTLITSYDLRKKTITSAQIADTLAQCEQGEQIFPEDMINTEISYFYLLCAQLMWHIEGDNDEAEQYLKSALTQSLSNENSALSPALDYYHRQSRYCSMASVFNLFLTRVEDLPEDITRRIQILNADCQPHELESPLL